MSAQRRGLSQEPGLAEPKMVDTSGFGHGCGHNLLGSAAMLAATAIKDWIEAEGIDARVRYYGCPAEEGGAAKTYMVREGLFDDVDLASTWHPASFNGVRRRSSFTCQHADRLHVHRQGSTCRRCARTWPLRA